MMPKDRKCYASRQQVLEQHSPRKLITRQCQPRKKQRRHQSEDINNTDNDNDNAVIYYSKICPCVNIRFLKIGDHRNRQRGRRLEISLFTSDCRNGKRPQELANPAHNVEIRRQI
jgi:hypothetical protein